MRTKVLPFLLLFSVISLLSKSQAPPTQVALGEYNCIVLNQTTHTAYDFDNNNGLPYVSSGSPSNVIFVGTGSHAWYQVDNNGEVWTKGQNPMGELGNGSSGGTTNSYAKITQDNQGNPFTKVIKAVGAYQRALFLKSDGTVWVVGDGSGGTKGDGSGGGMLTRPVQVNIPGNPFIKDIDISGGGTCGVLTNTGDVWTWGQTGAQWFPFNLGQGASPAGGGNSPGKLSLPAPAVEISMSEQFNFILLNNGKIYGFGGHEDVLGFTAGSGQKNTPIDLTPSLGVAGKSFTHISSNDVAGYAIASDGTLWAWGDFANGNGGDGQMYNWASTNYGWNQNIGLLMQKTATQIGKGKNNFTKLFGGHGFVYYVYVQDANNDLYSMGRNKYNVLGNAVWEQGTIGADFAQAWNVNWITRVTPLSITKGIQSTSPTCVTNPSTLSCPLYSIPSTPNPSCSAGSTQNISGSSTTLSGNATGNGGATVVYHIWTQVSGPGTAVITLNSDLNPTVSGLVTGTYVFQLKATDNNWRTATSTVTVNVNVTGPSNKPPVANAGTNQTITYPTTSASLDGTKSFDPDGTITGYSWTQTLGPSVANITSNFSASTTATGLVQGTYIFFLVVTDNQGATASAYDTVFVNTAPSSPSVNAGTDKTITLPTNSVNLTGTATGNNGATITSTAWSQTSGPNTATISNSANLNTAISGLAQGVYTFQLLATDNNSLSSTDQITITVKAANVPPNVDPGKSKTITLPTNNVTLTGVATGNNGATISSTSWTQQSGPNTASIANPASLSTNITGLVAGTYIFKLNATDNNGLSSSATVTVTVNNAADVPPTVNAGTDQTITLPTSSVAVTGTASGNNGATISTISWTQTGGPSTANIVAGSSLNTNISGLVQGVYTFQLAVTDNNGLTSTDALKVTVNAANVPPTVNAGTASTITLPTNSASLSGSASGNNGATISTTSWTNTSGPGAGTITSSSSLSTTVTGLTAGIYTFTLTVTDNNGLSNSATVTVTVNSPANQPPVANAGIDQTISLPATSVNLDGSRSFDPDGSIVAYTWTKFSGPGTVNFNNANIASPSVGNLQAGQYIFLLTVTDNRGAVASDRVTITVNALAPAPVPPPVVNQPPVANAGPSRTVTLPLASLILDGTGSSDPDGSITSYSWSEVSGPTSNFVNASAITPTVTNLQVGQYVFQLTVTDNQGASSSARVTIQVNAQGTPPAPPPTNLPPIANAGANRTVTLPLASLILDGTGSSDPDGSISSYSWSEVSGPTSNFVNASAITPTVTNLQVGQYIFQLTVTDNQGASSSDQVTIQVNAQNTPAVQTVPVANAGNDTTISLPASETMLNGTASYDPGGDIVSYTWQEMSGPNTTSIASPDASVSVVDNLIAGQYVFQLTVQNAAGAKSTAQVKVSVVNNLRSTEHMLVYPNPARNLVHLRIFSDSTGSMTVNIYDMNGRLVQSAEMNRQQTFSDNTLNVSKLTSGTYIIQAMIGTQKRLVTKLVKQ